MIASAIFPAALLATQFAQAGPTITTTTSSDPPASGELGQQFDDVLVTTAPAARTSKAQAPAGGALMNPDISVIFDGVAGAANRTRASSAGDDPDFGGPAARRTGGFAVQEVEVGFQSTVDP